MDNEDMLFFNSTWPPEESYGSEFVILCDKTAVNLFGAQLMPTFYCLIFLLSLLGNGLVLYILCKYEKLNTVTNIFLLNLVISDLVFSLSLPFWATYHSSEWIFGRVLCKLVGGVYFVGFYSSILFLTLMTFDRYLAVVHVVAATKRRRNVYAIISSAVVWSVSILASFKEFILYDVQDIDKYGTLCEETGSSKEVLAKWQVLGNCQQFVLFFLFPLAVVLYCYARIVIRILYTRMKNKCRTVKLIFVIVVTFFICWTPYNVVILLRTLEALVGNSSNSCGEQLDYALYITRNISILYCCVNPIFYTFVGKKFRSHFQNLLAKRVSWLNSQVSTTQNSRTPSQRSPVSAHE